MDGITWQTLAQATGEPVSQWQNALTPLEQQGLLAITDQRLACTDNGLRHLNGLLEKLASALL